MPTKIEWTDATWNPIVGCTKVSPACENCYAERMANRLAGMGRRGYVDVVENGRWNRKTAFVKSVLNLPLRWRKPRRVFVCSMSDFFHETAELDWQEQIWRVALSAIRNGHTMQFLTKRPKLAVERIPILMNRIFGTAPWKLPEGLWLGVTAEDQRQWSERLNDLDAIPATTKFASVEPMVGPVVPHGLKSLQWVICGGETGPGFREINPDWARLLRDKCSESAIPFFFKQMSGKAEIPEDLRIREFPVSEIDWKAKRGMRQ